MLTEYFYKGLATKNSPESFTKFIRNLSLERTPAQSRFFRGGSSGAGSY